VEISDGAVRVAGRCETVDDGIVGDSIREHLEALHFLEHRHRGFAVPLLRAGVDHAVEADEVRDDLRGLAAGEPSQRQLGVALLGATVDDGGVRADVRLQLQGGDAL